MAAPLAALPSPTWFVGEGDSPVRVKKWTCERGSSVSVWLGQEGLSYLWRKADGQKSAKRITCEDIPVTCEGLQNCFPLVDRGTMTFLRGIRSLMKETAIISLDEGAVTMISQGSSKRQSLKKEEGQSSPNPLQALGNSINACMALAGHAGVVIEWMENFQFFRKLIHLVQSRQDAGVSLILEGEFEAAHLEHIQKQSSTLILTTERVMNMVAKARKDIVKTHEDEKRILEGDNVEEVRRHAFKFSLAFPQPERLILNCISYDFELLKAGGVDLSILYDEKVFIPTRDVMPLDKLIKRAFKLEYKNLPKIEASKNDWCYDERVVALREEKERAFTVFDEMAHGLLFKGAERYGKCGEKWIDPRNWVRVLVIPEMLF